MNYGIREGCDSWWEGDGFWPNIFFDLSVVGIPNLIRRRDERVSVPERGHERRPLPTLNLLLWRRTSTRHWPSDGPVGLLLPVWPHPPLPLLIPSTRGLRVKSLRPCHRDEPLPLPRLLRLLLPTRKSNLIKIILRNDTGRLRRFPVILIRLDSD